MNITQKTMQLTSETQKSTHNMIKILTPIDAETVIQQAENFIKIGFHNLSQAQ